MTGKNRLRLLDLMLAALLGLAAFVLYASTLAPTLLAGDAGEFQFVPYLLGVAHPTGYPLYTLLGWAWSRLLPLGDVAFRMNLFSAFWAALAVGLLYPTARAALRQVLPDLEPWVQRLIAVLAAATFALTPTFWSQAVIAEVYSLQTFLVVSLFLLLLVWAGRRDTRLLLLAAVTFGFGLAHHRTTILLAPAVLAFILLEDRGILRDWRLVFKALILLLLPLALYLYIPVRAPSTAYLQLPLAQGRALSLYDNSLAGFLDFVTGGPFGGYLDLSLDLGARLTMTGRLLSQELGWVVLALALVGVVRLFASRCWSLLALTGLAYLVTVAFNLVYNIGDIHVLYIPSYLAVVLWLAVGVGALSRLGQRLMGQRRLAGVLIVLPFFLLPLWMAIHRYADLDHSQRTAVRKDWEAILAEPLPADAVLVSNDRNDIMPMWYLQHVDGLDPGWLGLFPQITAEYPTLGAVLDLALSTDRPVYLIKEMPGIEVKVAVEGEGRLWHILGQAATDQPTYSLDARLVDAIILTGYDLSPRSPGPGDDLEVGLYWEASGPIDRIYHSFVHLVDEAGQTLAQSDQQPGGVYYPTSLWRPGERLRDTHLLSVPPDVPTGVYRLLAGMYSLRQDGTLEPLGAPVQVGHVAIKTVLQTEPDQIDNPVHARFGEQFELLGYRAELRDQGLAVTLHWQALESTEANHTVFVHLLDADGEIVAQHDGQPQGGAYPTSVWDAGERVIDGHLLRLPPEGLPPGEYRLRVGLYSLESGQRLPVDGGDSVDLGPIALGE